jgi:hypothetical protein
MTTPDDDRLLAIFGAWNDLFEATYSCRGDAEINRCELTLLELAIGVSDEDVNNQNTLMDTTIEEIRTFHGYV